MPSHSDIDTPYQTVTTPKGDYEIAVARHAGAPTFSFDLNVRIGHLKTTPNGWVISCQNMTRADLQEHVARCQAALDKVQDGD